MSQPIPNSGGDYCDPDRVHHRRRHRRPAPHQRRPADLRHPDLRPLLGRRDRGQRRRRTGWAGGCGGGGSPNFVGPFVTNAPVLTPPPTNGELRTIAGPSYDLHRPDDDRRSAATSMTVINGGTTSGRSLSPPAASSTSPTASVAARPTTRRSPRPTRRASGCGNAVVTATGSYSSQLTIAAENDIIIEDDIIRTRQRPARPDRQQLRPGQAPLYPDRSRLHERHDHL